MTGKERKEVRGAARLRTSSSTSSLYEAWSEPPRATSLTTLPEHAAARESRGETASEERPPEKSFWVKS